MTQILHIPAAEYGFLHVFAINRAVGDMQKALARSPIADVARRLLAAPHLDTRGAEIFAITTLEGMGLAGYLEQGHGVDPAQMARDKPRIDALDGYVMLLFSGAFGGKAIDLNLGADVTYIAKYSDGAPRAASTAIHAASAQPYSGARAAPPHPGPRIRGLGFGAALLALALFIWWLFV